MSPPSSSISIHWRRFQSDAMHEFMDGDAGDAETMRLCRLAFYAGSAATLEVLSDPVTAAQMLTLVKEVYDVARSQS
jgi:hypothetical protein